MKLYKMILCTMVTSLMSSSVWAQQDTIKTEQIEVIKEYKPFVEEGIKQSFQPVLPQNTAQGIGQLNYNVPSEFIETQFEPQEIRPLPIQTENNTALRHFYVKGGYGNKKNPLAQIAINGAEQENYSIGALLDYEAISGDLDHQKMDKAALSLFGNKELSDKTLHTDFNYKRLASNFYGYNNAPSAGSIAGYTVDQTYNQFGGRLGLDSAHDSDEINYALAGVFNILNQDLYDFKENRLGMIGEVILPINDDIGGSIHLDLMNRVTKTPQNLNSDNQKTNNLLLHSDILIQPQFDNLTTSLGVSLNNDKDNDFKIFPNIKLEYRVDGDNFILFAGWNGRTKQNGIENMIQENAWLSNQAQFKNYTEQIITPIGVKANINKQFNIQASLNRITRKNMPLLVNGDGTGNLDLFNYGVFTPVYEDKLSSWSPQADLNYQLGDRANLSGHLMYQSLKTESENEAWGMPRFQSGVDFNIKVIEKLALSAGFNTLSGIAYKDTNGQEGTLVGNFNLSLGAQYQILDRLSLFVDGHNLTNSQFERWKNYSTVGTNFLFGAVFSY